MIKFIMNMNNSRTHPNLGADRWGPQLCPMGKSLAGSGRQFGATILQVGPATPSTDGVTQSQISVKTDLWANKCLGTPVIDPVIPCPPYESAVSLKPNEPCDPPNSIYNMIWRRRFFSISPHPRRG